MAYPHLYILQGFTKGTVPTEAAVDTHILYIAVQTSLPGWCCEFLASAEKIYYLESMCCTNSCMEGKTGTLNHLCITAKVYCSSSWRVIRKDKLKISWTLCTNTQTHMGGTQWVTSDGTDAETTKGKPDGAYPFPWAGTTYNAVSKCPLHSGAGLELVLKPKSLFQVFCLFVFLGQQVAGACCTWPSV